MKPKPTLKIMALRLPEPVIAYIKRVAADAGVKPGTTLREFVLLGMQEHVRRTGQKDTASARA